MQFSLRNALIATAAVSVACAGLVYANIWWAGLFITLAAVLAGVSLVGAFAASGTERAEWIGCFVFGAGYLLLVYGPHVDRVIGPTLLTTKALAWAQPKVQRIVPFGERGIPMGGGGPDAALSVEHQLALMREHSTARPLVTNVPRSVLPQWLPFQQVGHGFASMLAGVCGSALGAGMARGRKQGAPEPAV